MYRALQHRERLDGNGVLAFVRQDGEPEREVAGLQRALVHELEITCAGTAVGRGEIEAAAVVARDVPNSR